MQGSEMWRKIVSRWNFCKLKKDTSSGTNGSRSTFQKHPAISLFKTLRATIDKEVSGSWITCIRTSGELIFHVNHLA